MNKLIRIGNSLNDIRTKADRKGNHGNEIPTKLRDNVSPSKQKIVSHSRLN